MRSLPKAQHGFVFVATIWMIAVVFIFAAFFASYAEQQLEFSIAVKERRTTLNQQFSTQQTLLYVMATHRFTLAGLSLRDEHLQDFVDDDGNLSIDAVGNELKIDGMVYKGIGDVFMSINDEAGLLALNSGTNYHLDQALQSFEPDVLVRQSLLNLLDDYKDADNLIRLSGAERQEYLAAKLEPPRDAMLRSTVELENIMGWRDWLPLHPEFKYRQWTSTDWKSAINPNTIPVSLLSKLAFLDDDLSKSVVAARNGEPFRSTDDLVRRSGSFILLDENNFKFFPSTRVRILTFSENNRNMQTIVVEFTPFNLSHPWLIETRYNSERHFEIDNEIATARTKYFGPELFSAKE